MRICTLEFIELLKQQYEVLLFPVKINPGIVFKVKVRLGLGSYDAYNPGKYLEALRNTIKENTISLVFLNLSNLTRFSPVIKEASNGNAKVILCSHGNESGDFLHEVVQFRSKISFAKRLFSSYSLGRMLRIESFYRLYYIDIVLTVSEVESKIEKWLGAKKVFMVPRTVIPNFLMIEPISNRVGFVGDLSHFPNKSGIVSFCDALSKLKHTIEVRIAGGPAHIGKALQSQFPFITYLGYVDNETLEKECATWCLFLNLVFYYSRGVSTKLAKPLGWGLPVISTTAGIRGYTWKNGKMTIAETADEMAELVVNICSNPATVSTLMNEAREIPYSMPSLKNIMEAIKPIMDTPEDISCPENKKYK